MILEFSKRKELTFIVPKEEERGVLRVAKKVAKDVEKTAGVQPEIADTPTPCAQAILAVTAGSGETARKLGERIPQLKEAEGKWEVYGFCLVEEPLEGIEKALVIYGSDKLGTIYGLFHLSELLGVSPCVFWGDAEGPTYEAVFFTEKNSAGKHRAASGGEVPGQKKDGYICGDGLEYRTVQTEKTVEIENSISREPSVKYRGFFINDEWPCFGNWTFSHYGGFTAEMYDKVFEYLLRMKGNYLWPAMWTSSFLVDGPGMASMELADEYGIYIGMSHHEPCMRSSEEWDMVKGEDTPYGTEWSYLTNKEGLLKYWEEGLKRSKGHSVFPTIGMRGERDSKMLGDDAAVGENVRVLKDIITNQKRLIAEHLQEKGQELPLLFAVYKEVEDYYFGDGTESLRDFQELEGVTLLLCEDNFGNMRALPKAEERNRKGGFGMYYHLDYHGGPVSYEWVASVPLTKIWEQMTMAYEYGIRELWIVNVGDLKFQEYPLNYFMELAYDFEAWGSSAPNQTSKYTRLWVEKQFGAYTSPEEQEKIGWVTEEYIRLNHLRRPEACNKTVYHSAHYEEGARMLARCERLEQENEKLLALLREQGREKAYYSMIYYPAAASANLLKMHLLEGLNHLYAAQGRADANAAGEKMELCIQRDEALSGELAAFENGKWAGMELAYHIGFTNWNSEDWRYPVRHVLRLPKQPRLVVCRTDDTKSYTNQYFPEPILIDDFQESETEQVSLDIVNGGAGVLKWSIETACGWLKFSQKAGETKVQDRLTVQVDKGCFTRGKTEEGEFKIRSGEEFVPVLVKAAVRVFPGIVPGTFIPENGVYVMRAEEYAERKEGVYQGRAAGFERLEDYGKYGSGMKVFPVTASFEREKALEQVPSLTYQLWCGREGACRLQIHTSPANPLVYGGILSLGIAVNGETAQQAVITPEGYKGGDNDCRQWEEAVLAQEHVADMEIYLKSGVNRITVYAQEAGVVLERLVVYRKEQPPKSAYLGANPGICSKV